MEYKWDALSQMAGDKHNSSFYPQHKQQDNTSTWQLWVWLHLEEESKKILLNPAKLALLLRQADKIYMRIPLLLFWKGWFLLTPCRFWQAIQTPLSENIFWCIHKCEQTTTLVESKLLPATALAARLYSCTETNGCVFSSLTSAIFVPSC